MARRQNRRAVVMNLLRGMWSGGDAAAMPEGFLRKVRNMLLRPNRWQARPQFTYDNLASVQGLAQWEDEANKVTRLVAVDTSGNLYAKGVGSEAWGGAVAGVSGARLTAATTYRGKLVGMLDDGAGNPSGAFSYDGTTVITSPFNSTIYSRAMVAFKERLFLAHPRVAVATLNSGTVASNLILSSYDWTFRWNSVNVAALAVAQATGATVGRLVPTSTAVSGCSMSYSETIGPTSIVGITSAPASAVPLKYTWRWEVRGIDPAYRVPFTLEWLVGRKPLTSTAYVVGDVVAVAPYRYRATVAGMTGAVAPTWGATVGGTTSDGAVTWLNEGSDVLAAREGYVLNATESTEWQAYYLTCVVPPRTNTVELHPRLKLYNSSTTALTTLAPIEISFRDGKPDGAIDKKNHGSQWTSGEFYYPFFNAESTNTNTVDLDQLIWSEIADPSRIRAANYFSPQGPSGLPTALTVAAGRLILFKRNAIWVFQPTDDPDSPIVPEGDVRVGIGCIGPKAIDTFEDTIYFVGENEVYAWRVGSVPVPLCGDAMREEIMGKSSTSWVESQTYKSPLLRVDQKNREVWVYTQKGKLYCYDIDEKAWSVHDAGGGTSVTPVGYEVRDIAFHPTTGNLYVAFGTAATGVAGVARLDPSVSTADDQISTTGTLPLHAEVWSRPIEGADILVESVTAHHAVSASQVAQTTTAAISFDQGRTFAATNQVELYPLSGGEYRPMEIPLYQMGRSLLLRLLHTGKGGSASWNLSSLEMTLQSLGNEYRRDTPIQGTATL